MFNTLRKLSFLALFAVFFAVPGCIKNGPTPNTPVGAFEHCSSDALRASSEGILGEVTTALATGDFEAQLIALAAKFTPSEVGCAVDLAISEFTKKAARSDDTQVAVILVHAKAFRAEHP